MIETGVNTTNVRLNTQQIPHHRAKQPDIKVNNIPDFLTSKSKLAVSYILPLYLPQISEEIKIHLHIVLFT